MRAGNFEVQVKLNRPMGGYRRNLDKFLFGISVFCITALCSAVFFSSIGINSEVDKGASAADTDLSVKLDPTLSVRVVKDGSDIDTLTLVVDPVASGRFVKDNLSVLVSTSNETGYALTLADKDADTAMHHIDTTVTATIPSITNPASGSITEDNFPVNSWGYSLGDINSSAQTFNAIPASTAPAVIKTTTASSTEDATPVTFATKVDTSIPSGTYLDTVVFSATANYVPNVLERLTYMQDMTPAVCASATIGDEATLTDSRDGKTYNIRKMEDGKCWMVQNLALGDATKDITLTPADSNVVASFTIPANTVQTSGTADWSTNVDSIHVYDNGNTWIEPTSAGNSSVVHTNGSTPPSQSQYVGGYYNWYTATAGTGIAAMTTGNAPSSICPKGWRLPTGGASSDFTNLTNALVGITTNSTSVSAQSFTMQSSPNHFILSGHHVGYPIEQGNAGDWWSSNAYNTTASYYLYLNTSYVYPQKYDFSYKYYGFSVRCVADNTITGISTMQEMTSDICAATPTPAASATTVPQATLTDTRDGNTYVVRKLADGNCWMVQNLDLDLSTSVALNSSTSDLSPGRTWTPQNNTQIIEGTVWADNGGDVARSFEPGENLYFPNGVGTGIADTYGNLTGSTTGQPWEHVGNYYNWYAATAGTGTAAMASGNATDSICPKGWKLPDNSGTKSFLNLITTTYGLQDNSTTDVTKLLRNPLNFVWGGYYYWSDGRVYYKGASGNWRSATAHSATIVYQFTTYSSHILPQNITDKGSGLTIRCVAR